ncbi:MAG: hypothetical protein AAB403_08290, partial [Planctomycetota bacterium]
MKIKWSTQFNVVIIEVANFAPNRSAFRMAFCSLKVSTHPPVKSRTPVISTLLGCGQWAAL